MVVSGFYILGDLRKFWAREYSITTFRDYLVDIVYQSLGNVKRATLCFYFGKMKQGEGYVDLVHQEITGTINLDTVNDAKFYRLAIDKVLSTTQPKRSFSGILPPKEGFLFAGTIRLDILGDDLKREDMPCIEVASTGSVVLTNDPDTRTTLFGKINKDMYDIPVLYLSTNQSSLDITAKDLFDRGVNIPSTSTYYTDPSVVDFSKTLYTIPVKCRNIKGIKGLTA